MFKIIEKLNTEIENLYTRLNDIYTEQASISTEAEKLKLLISKLQLKRDTIIVSKNAHLINGAINWKWLLDYDSELKDIELKELNKHLHRYSLKSHGKILKSSQYTISIEFKKNNIDNLEKIKTGISTLLYYIKDINYGIEDQIRYFKSFIIDVKGCDNLILLHINEDFKYYKVCIDTHILFTDNTLNGILKTCQNRLYYK
jgi:hypothetical protein